MKNLVSKMPRMYEWMLVTLIMLAFIAHVKPELIGNDIHKLSLVGLGAVVGYGIDRKLFPYARPDSFLMTTDWSVQVKNKCCNGADVPVVPGYELIYAVSQLRRAIIVVGTMFVFAQGI